MSDVHLVRGQSEESEDSEDIFQSTFSSSNSGKVKIVGSCNSHIGLAASKLSIGDTQLEAEKTDPVKYENNDHVQHSNDRNSRDVAASSPTLRSVVGGLRGAQTSPLQRANSEQGSAARISHVQCQTSLRNYLSSPDDAQEEEEDAFIEITISEPHKVGEGISSYLAYRVNTRTNLRFFKRSQFTVSRRFSDFLGLHEKLGDKYLSRGRVIPPAPEKSLLSTTKVKVSSSSSNGSDISENQHLSSSTTVIEQAEFITRRRFALERFINRVAQHPVLRRDFAFVEFLEMVRELPRATSTSAISSASVLRLLGRVGDTVNKMTYRMEENDPWYEEKVQQIEHLDSQLRKLYLLVDSLVQCRHELALATGAFAQSTAMLSNVEEAHSLSRALAHLSRVEEKVEQVHHHQAEADYFYLFELIKDYVALICAVKDVFAERNKAFQNWQHAQSMVVKKKEQRARLEMGGRTDKMPSANDEVVEWEGRLVEYQENFNQISAVIKEEIDLFERYRVKDFKVAIIQYLESLMSCQLEMVKHWEEFLPEVKSVLF